VGNQRSSGSFVETLSMQPCSSAAQKIPHKPAARLLLGRWDAGGRWARSFCCSISKLSSQYSPPPAVAAIGIPSHHKHRPRNHTSPRVYTTQYIPPPRCTLVSRPRSPVRAVLMRCVMDRRAAMQPRPDTALARRDTARRLPRTRVHRGRSSTPATRSLCCFGGRATAAITSWPAGSSVCRGG